MSLSPHGYRVETARRTGCYEPLRAQMTVLLMHHQYTYEECAKAMGTTRSVIRLAVIVLGLEVGKGRHGLNQAVDDMMRAAALKADLDLVSYIRREYGVIGKGFSTA